MKKNEYVSPKMTLIFVSKNDIITSSGNVGGGIIVTPEDEFEDEITNG